jgi:hypothetical protein
LLEQPIAAQMDLSGDWHVCDVTVSRTTSTALPDERKAPAVAL